MANTVSILSYGNTFGELVTTQNALARENNALAANNYTKETGTLFLSDPDLGLQIANNAVVQGGLKVQGIGSYARIDNNLRVDGQIYFTNNTIGMTNFGQANVYGLLYANATGNSIISTNNVTVGGNTFITGNVYSANNLVISKNATISGETLIRGTTNVANNLLVTQNTYVTSVVIADQFIANTTTLTPVARVTGLLDAGLATSQLHIVTANNLTSTRGYISTLQSNTVINTASVNATTLYAQSLTTPVANVGNILDANNATAYLKNLQVTDEFTVKGSFVVQGGTQYTSNTFELLSGTTGAYNAFYTVNRGTNANNAVLRWNETAGYWDLNDVSTNQYYRILSTQQINDTLVSTSTIQPASANVANTLYTLLNAANTYLQLAVVNAGNFANSGFGHANAAFDAANNVAPQITPTFDRANAAFSRANTSTNTIIGTSGTITPTNGSLSFQSNNGVVIAGSANNLFFNTAQDIRTSAAPQFTNLTLTNALAVTQGGTGAQSSAVALQNLLPSTVGVPSGYILGTTGGLGASFNWVAGGSGGGGSSVSPGTRISTNRLNYTASENQTDFTTPSYTTGSGQLRVYVNGVRQYTSDYTETSSTSVSLTSPLKENDTVLIEVDGYYTWVNSANATSFTAPFGGIISSANTVQLAIESIETRKAPLASPSFTGVPTSTKASMQTSNTWIATTNWVTEWANTGYTYTMNITGRAGTVVNGVYTNGSYSDPTWLTITKAKVGLGNVDNTADANKSVAYAGYSKYLSGALAYTNGSDGWFRSEGTAGWYNATYAGGIYMADTSWVRTYGTKDFYCDGPNGIYALKNVVAYYSDERLKERKGNITGALESVCKLNGFRYVNNEVAKQHGYTSDEIQLGVSAQEVESMFPEIVTLAPFDVETKEDGTLVSKSGQNYRTLDYSKLVPVLIEAIKELKAEVEELKGKTK